MINRLTTLQAKIRQRGWDAFWVVHPANRQYLTGFTGSAGWVLISASRRYGESFLLTDGRYTEQAAQECGSKIHVQTARRDWHAILARTLRKRKIRTLGFEDAYLTVRSWQRMRKLRPDVRWQSASGLIEKLRMIKDTEELLSIKTAIHIAEKAFSRVLPKIKVNITERAIAHHLEKAMMDLGAEGLAFPTIVASGPNSALPHAQLTNRKLKPYDLLVIDFGCKYKGYHSDLTRTMAVAKMTKRQQEIYKIVKNAQKSAKNMLICGQIISNSDKKAKRIFKQAGLNQYFIHSLGHGLGLEIHEAPQLCSACHGRLRPGMIVTCEPGIYLPGWGGIRIEDDVLIGPSPQWLSRSSEILQVVGRL